MYILAILSNQYNTCALNNFSTILFALNHDKEKSISDFSMCVYIQFQCASLVPDWQPHFSLSSLLLNFRILWLYSLYDIWHITAPYCACLFLIYFFFPRTFQLQLCIIVQKCTHGSIEDLHIDHICSTNCLRDIKKNKNKTWCFFTVSTCNNYQFSSSIFHMNIPYNNMLYNVYFFSFFLQRGKSWERISTKLTHA